MSRARKRLGEAGQAQLLTAVVFSGVMLSGGLFAMQWAQRNRIQDFYASRRVEMRSALEQGIKRLQQIYTTEAGCDPISFDAKVNLLRPDGSIAPAGSAPGLRQFQVTVNGHLYDIAFSHPARLTWTGETGSDPTLTLSAGVLVQNRGTSQDLVIEAWTTYNSRQGSSASPGILHQRTVQRAVLINTCTNTCSIGLTAECPVAGDRGMAYHRIMAASFPGNTVYPTAAAWNRRCYDPFGGVRYLGDVNTSPLTGVTPLVAADGMVSVEDLRILKNYIRSGDSGGAGPNAGQVTHVSVAGSGFLPCSDLNGDSMVNETDLHIMEKVMRGYLYWLPVNPPAPAP